MTDTSRAADSRRYSVIAILLHWSLAALILLQVVLAGRMEGRSAEAFAIIQLHKSIGITVLLLSLLRLVWRLVNPPPPEPAGLATWELRLSAAVHVAFYVVMVGMPVTGWIMVSTSKYVIPTLLFGVVPWPHLPFLPELAPAARHVWNEAGEAGHGLIVKGFYVLIALHVAGALKHQFFANDVPVLQRMAPGAKARRPFDPWLIAIVLGVIGVVAFGGRVQPARPHLAAPAAVPVTVTPPVEPQAVATPAPAPSAEATPVRAGPAVWKIQAGSTLSFATTWSGDAVTGRFDKWSSDILFSPDALDRSRISVAIDLASVNTGDAQRDASLPTSDWFDAATHPKATFTATRFEKTGEGRFVAHGKLSLRGVSRPLDLPFRLKIDGDRAEVSGVTSLDRTAFGVGQGEWANTDQIPAKVSVRIALKARRTSP